MTIEDFYTQFSDTNPGELLISRGPDAGKISLKIGPECLMVLVDGEPDGDTLTACFEDALASGHSNIAMPTLVDLTRFYGQPDWKALRAVRDMAPWGKACVAYVMRADAMPATAIKIAGALFANSQHRIFTNHADALAWLKST